MKAFVSILFSAALIWTQIALTPSRMLAAEHASQSKCSACPCAAEKMSCCVVPTNAPATTQIPAAPRQVKQDESTPSRAPQPRIAYEAAVDSVHLPRDFFSVSLPAAPALYTRHCSFLI